jgi:hypothetical protein
MFGYNVITDICGFVAESREAAYVHAVSAAGIAYTVTRACSRGELNECSCDSRVRSRKPKGKWQWGGCSEVSD